MTIFEYLKRAKNMDVKINSDIKEQDELQRLAVTIGEELISVNLSKKLAETQNRINEEIDEMIKFKNEIGKTIEKLDNEYMIAILKGRFINGMTINQISESMHYSRTNIYYLYHKAIERLSEITGLPISELQERKN